MTSWPRKCLMFFFLEKNPFSDLRLVTPVRQKTSSIHTILSDSAVVLSHRSQQHHKKTSTDRHRNRQRAKETHLPNVHVHILKTTPGENLSSFLPGINRFSYSFSHGLPLQRSITFIDWVVIVSLSSTKFSNNTTFPKCVCNVGNQFQ